MADHRGGATGTTSLGARVAPPGSTASMAGTDSINKGRQGNTNPRGSTTRSPTSSGPRNNTASNRRRNTNTNTNNTTNTFTTTSTRRHSTSSRRTSGLPSWRRGRAVPPGAGTTSPPHLQTRTPLVRRVRAGAPVGGAADMPDMLAMRSLLPRRFRSHGCFLRASRARNPGTRKRGSLENVQVQERESARVPGAPPWRLSHCNGRTVSAWRATERYKRSTGKNTNEGESTRRLWATFSLERRARAGARRCTKNAAAKING